MLLNNYVNTLTEERCIDQAYNCVDGKVLQNKMNERALFVMHIHFTVYT